MNFIKPSFRNPSPLFLSSNFLFSDIDRLCPPVLPDTLELRIRRQGSSLFKQSQSTNKTPWVNSKIAKRRSKAVDSSEIFREKFGKCNGISRTDGRRTQCLILWEMWRVRLNDEKRLNYIWIYSGNIKKSVRMAIEELHAWTCIRFQSVNDKYTGEQELLSKIGEVGRYSSKLSRSVLCFTDQRQESFWRNCPSSADNSCFPCEDSCEDVNAPEN